MTLGKRIKDLRNQRGITQRDLAERVMVHFTYISKIENNAVSIPPSETVLRDIAAVLNSDANELYILAGQFSFDRLRKLAMAYPNVCKVLRALECSDLSDEQTQKILDIVGDCLPH